MSDGPLQLKYIQGSVNVHLVLCHTITCKNKTRKRVCNTKVESSTELSVNGASLNGWSSSDTRGKTSSTKFFVHMLPRSILALV